MNILITSGYNQSLHTIALINELIKQNHKIIGCLIVNTYQLDRLSKYVKMYGWNNVLSKFKNSVLGLKSDKIGETFYIKQFLNDRSIDFKSVISICEHYNIKRYKVSNLNDLKTTNVLRENNIDLIVYSGGGILKKDLINISRFGVINAHAGELPFFRGMNVVEWALINKIRPKISVHMIDTGIDTGDILLSKDIYFSETNSLTEIRGISVVQEIEALIEVLSNFHRYYKNKTKQLHASGKQYFVMHKTLVSLISKNIKTIKKALN